MNLFSRTNNRSIKKAVLKESGEDCPNPGRGWYRIYSMDAAVPVPIFEWQYSMEKDETLALLEVDIGAFAGGELSGEALTHIRQAFLFFQKEEKELLLRFVYDREGKGLEKEPADIRRIYGHIEQLAPLLAEFGDMIFCIQGLFVGSWGEMHDSRFLTEKALGMLWQHVYRLFPESCFFAVRRPDQWKSVTGLSGPFPEVDIARMRLGLFNDGLLGSATDLGTFPEGERADGIRFQDQLCRYVPNGGEAVGTDRYGEVEQAAEYFRSIHVSYLNSVYDERVLNRWKNSTYLGENGYEYMGHHLGFRFVLTDAALVRTGKQQRIQIVLENRGFAAIYEECEIVLCGGGRTVMPSFGMADLRRLLPGSRMKVQFILTDDCFGELAVGIYRKRDHRSIRLANVGAGKDFIIGRLGNA
jgi:hypothetical protein